MRQSRRMMCPSAVALCSLVAGGWRGTGEGCRWRHGGHSGGATTTAGYTATSSTGAGGGDGADAGADAPASGCAGFPASRVYIVEASYGEDFDDDAALGVLAGMRCIEGDVSIGEVASLAPLSELERVVGNLALGSSQIQSLEDLQRLERVDGVLTIARMDALVSLAGLEGLKHVRSLHLGRGRLNPGMVEPSPHEGNDALVEVSALAGLEVVKEVIVSDNEALSSLEGLPMPTGDGGPPSIEITLNPKLPYSQIADYLLGAPPGTEFEHCGNLGDPPCKAGYTD